jgi:hypothetical protein
MISSMFLNSRNVFEFPLKLFEQNKIWVEPDLSYVEYPLSVKTHRQAATGNTRSREASGTADGSRSLGQRPISPAHALAWWSARRATWPIPDQEGVEVVVSYFPACTAMSNISPSRERLLTWLPRSARRADGASALGQTYFRTRLDLREPLRIGWKKPIAPFIRSDLLIFKRLVWIRQKK